MKKAFTLAEGATHVVNWDNSHKIAFTLAEVLITLGIIGVVAAMTLPTVINNVHHKELETALKKQYSTLSQAILDIQREDDLPFEYESYRSNFKTELAAKYKAAQNCGAINNNTGCVINEIDGTFLIINLIQVNLYRQHIWTMEVLLPMMVQHFL